MASQSRNRLGRPILQWDNVHPDNTACVDLETGQRWTFSALDASVNHAISQLRDGFPSPPNRETHDATLHPVKKGDRVAIVAKNNIRHIILFLAAMRMGVIFVPLSWRLPPRELQRLLADCTPTVLIAEDLGPLREVLPAGCRGVDLEDMSIGLLESSPISDSEADDHDGVCARDSDSASVPPAVDDTCLLLYTSGSTGLPKGVRHTPRSLHATAVSFAASASISTARPLVLLVDLPIFHVIGSVVCILAPLHLGGTVLVSSKFDAERTNSRLADVELGVSHYFCVPTMADALRSAPNFQPAKWQKLEQLFTGGSPNPASNVRWWLDRGIKMLDGYGMTETGTICTMPMSHDSVGDVVRVKAGSVGLPGPLTEIRMVDSQGCDVPRGSPGEILVAGDHVSPGYWQACAEGQAAAASLAAAPAAASVKRWFPTGDVAVQDADGFVYIVDRKKDVYISGGENIYPSEVEAVLREHALLSDVAVVSMPDAVWGEVGCAFVVAESSDKAIEEGELQNHCRERLAPYKIPKRFVFVEALPRNATGKVLKRVLQDRAGCGTTASGESGVPGKQNESGSGRGGVCRVAWLAWCSAMPRGGLLRDQGRWLLSFVGKLLRLLVGSY